MGELENCPKCGKLFMKTKLRDLCQDCWKEEEAAFEAVYRFMRKRENRAATIPQIEKATGVEEELILKFIKSGRLQVTHFPNLGYPCDRCGKIIQRGKLCESCAGELKSDLEIYNADAERKKQLNRATYYSNKE